MPFPITILTTFVLLNDKQHLYSYNETSKPVIYFLVLISTFVSELRPLVQPSVAHAIGQKVTYLSQ